MNLLLIEENEILGEGLVKISDYRFLHLRDILKVEKSQRLKTAVVDKGVGFSEITEIGRDFVEVRLFDICETVEKNQISLLIAIPRPQSIKKILEFSATVGIKEIFFINSRRVEGNFFNSRVLLSDNIKESLFHGMEQGGTYRKPKVSILNNIRPSYINKKKTVEVETFLDKLHGFESKILADLNTRDYLSKLEKKELSNVVIAIGPEGGWLENEVESFHQIGFKSIKLSDYTLRVETAVTYAVAQLEGVLGS